VSQLSFLQVSICDLLYINIAKKFCVSSSAETQRKHHQAHTNVVERSLYPSTHNVFKVLDDTGVMGIKRILTPYQSRDSTTWLDAMSRDKTRIDPR